MELGADFLGFVLAPSARSVTLSQLQDLVTSIPATVQTVAVVVNPEQNFADSLLDWVDRIQFHGEESPQFCARYGRRGIKAFRIREISQLDTLDDYATSVGAYLLDSFKQGQAGGTGHSFPWSYLEKRVFSRPTFLAGGLNPSNVKDALKVEAVCGLDLSSGLEARPGEKDPELMREFFRSAWAHYQ